MQSIDVRSEREAQARRLPVVFVASFFVFTLPHAMVAAPMRTRFDQFGEQMVRTALETCGTRSGGAVARGWPRSSTVGACSAAASERPTGE
jgi:hypothetical protein